MPVPTLAQLACRACCKNIRSIKDVGDAPYEVVRPVLTKVENPEQLKVIEDASPQIIGHDAEIWREFIRRDIPNWEQKPHEAANPASWYKVYRKLLKASKKEVDEDAQLLKATLDSIKDKRAQNVAKKVELNVVKVPAGMKASGDVIRLPKNSAFFAKEQNSRDLKPEYTQWERKHGRIEGNHLHPKLKSTPASIPAPKTKIAQFRKEALAMSRFPKAHTKGIISPRDIRPIANQTEVPAPAALLHEYRKTPTAKPIDLSTPIQPLFNPKRKRTEPEGNVDNGDELAHREVRLRAMKLDSSKTMQDVAPSSGTADTRTADMHPSGHTSNDYDEHAPSAETKAISTSAAISSVRNNAEYHSTQDISSTSIRVTRRPAGRIKAKAPINPFMPVKRQRVH